MVHIDTASVRGLSGRPVHARADVWDQLAELPLPQGLAVDVGGEGIHAGVLNLNPSATRMMPGDLYGTRIPNLVIGSGEQMPLRDASVAWLTLENAPIPPTTAREIARVMIPGGRVELLNPLRGGARILHRRVLLEMGGVHYLQRVVRGSDPMLVSTHIRA